MYAVVLITAPDRESGVKMARRLLERRLAACVNIAPVSSMYWWEGKIEESSEVLLVVKTTSERLGDLIREVRAIHPYKVPEIIALPITAGLADYLDWVRRETGA
ncbi:MAG: divalent-cation tolerance protein CutA [Thermoproteaceae archaeon]|jgi:periplasmic divalent cation tolerance protein|nr:divalent-cation tolerance protein CutA [Thermoproteaceae archaeon]